MMCVCVSRTRTPRGRGGIVGGMQRVVYAHMPAVGDRRDLLLPDPDPHRRHCSPPPQDQELLDILPVLMQTATADDVREVLKDHVARC